MTSGLHVLAQVHTPEDCVDLALRILGAFRILSSLDIVLQQQIFILLYVVKLRVAAFTSFLSFLSLPYFIPPSFLSFLLFYLPFFLSLVKGPDF